MTFRRQISSCSSFVYAALLLAPTSYAAPAINNVTNPVSTFLSRPDLSAPYMNVSIQNSAYWEPGYVFIAPYQNSQPGPYIYDKFGNLIYSGFGATGGATGHQFRPCPYQNSTYLCLVQGNQLGGYMRGQGLILDSNYRPVHTLQVGNSLPPADQHEFLMVNGGDSVLMTSYKPVAYDLSAFNVTASQGYIMTGVFQEVDVATGRINFEWDSLNHVDPSASVVLPGTTDVSGYGNFSSPWDYFHINAVDKSPVTGNYIVSARYTSSLYYISATDGSIIWTLSSANHSDYQCTNFNFSYQHDVRIRSENASTTILTLYDNAANGFANTSTVSSGMVIAVNHDAHTATLLQQYVSPISGGLLSASQGNLQTLSNGNVLMGSGSWPDFAEFTADGNAVWAAQLSVGLQGYVMNYRVFSAPWVSIPDNTVPSVYAYSQNPGAPTAVYVSWNGCTEIGSWRFYGSQDPTAGDWTQLAEVLKDGFETMFVSQAHYNWVFAEAVQAGNGTSLRNSTYTQTFMPGQQLTASGACDGLACRLTPQD